eukprot:1803652-Ditylum_brightwellii.AAC.1
MHPIIQPTPVSLWSHPEHTYTFKMCTFSNRSPEDVLEWEKKMQNIFKCKLVDTVEKKFDIVEVFLEEDTLTHWLEFKQVETMHTNKNLDRTGTVPLGMSMETFKLCMQEFKKHYFPKNLAWLQKAYLYNHIKCKTS